MLKKHATQNSNNTILPPNEQQNNILNNEISNENKNNFSNWNNDNQCVDNIVISTFDFENAVELLYQSTVKFILSLHVYTIISWYNY